MFLKIMSDMLWDTISVGENVAEMVKKIRKDNVGIIPEGLGFDTTYILPGLGNLDMDSELDLEDGVTYNKGQLKRAFAKMSNAKIVNRPLLNNFIKMVA